MTAPRVCRLCGGTGARDGGVSRRSRLCLRCGARRVAGNLQVLESWGTPEWSDHIAKIKAGIARARDTRRAG